MRRWLYDEDTGKVELQEVNPKTGAWETIKEPDTRFEYGVFPLIRELYRGTRRVKWVGLQYGWSAAFTYDSGTDFRL